MKKQEFEPTDQCPIDEEVKALMEKVEKMKGSVVLLSSIPDAYGDGGTAFTSVVYGPRRMVVESITKAIVTGKDINFGLVLSDAMLESLKYQLKDIIDDKELARAERNSNKSLS